MPIMRFTGKSTGTRGDSEPIRTGVVIGSYGMPSVVELNVACIRKTCGGVPILIADDCTPEGEGLPRLRQIPRKYDNVCLSVNERPYGHASGDVTAFQRGLTWASELGIQVLVKFSQRLLITTPGWLAADARWLLSNGYAAASQRAFHLNMYFAMRTEAVLMDVSHAPAVVPLMQDCKTAAEDHVRSVYDRLGLSVGRWPRIPPDRFHPYNGVIWHNTHGVDVYGEGGEAYYRLADELGVELGPDFSAAGWHVIAAHRPGTEYAHFK